MEEPTPIQIAEKINHCIDKLSSECRLNPTAYTREAKESVFQLLSELDKLYLQLADYRTRFGAEASQEKCHICGKYNSPSLIESGTCIFCISTKLRAENDKLTLEVAAMQE